MIPNFPHIRWLFLILVLKLLQRRFLALKCVVSTEYSHNITKRLKLHSKGGVTANTDEDRVNYMKKTFLTTFVGKSIIITQEHSKHASCSSGVVLSYHLTRVIHNWCYLCATAPYPSPGKTVSHGPASLVWLVEMMWSPAPIFVSSITKWPTVPWYWPAFMVCLRI